MKEVYLSLSFYDILLQVFVIFIIALAGAESAIGLSILVAYYRLNGHISFLGIKSINP
jgi:NADH-ubiquinone oxidoreductase chain 4L